ncbi:MAG: acetoacetate decarboxylase family protein [Pseudonocardiaceae bacterium]
MTIEYPPQPWDLRGDMYASVWRIPVGGVPSWPLPEGRQPLTVGGRLLLLTLWVDYREGGVLEYHEFITALFTAHRRHVSGTIVQAWVDSPASVNGGRELWSIPKDLAGIDISAPGRLMTARLHIDGAELASGQFRRRWRIPGRWTVPTHVTQHREGSPLHVPTTLRGTLELGHSMVRVGTGGPLTFLEGHRPVISAAVRDFRFRVGAHGDKPDPLNVP